MKIDFEKAIGFNLSITDRKTLARIETKLDIIINHIFEGQAKIPEVDQKEVSDKVLNTYKKLGDK